MERGCGDTKRAMGAGEGGGDRGSRNGHNVHLTPSGSELTGESEIVVWREREEFCGGDEVQGNNNAWR